MTKKIALTAALVTLGFAASALASAPTVTLGGYLDTEYGFLSEQKNFRFADQNGGGHGPTRRDHALVNNTKITVRADGKLESMMGAKYGAMAKLNADTSDGQYDANNYDDDFNAQQTMAYFEGPFGRIEAGSYTGVSHALHVSATQLGKGTIGGIDAAGGIDSDWWQWINPYDYEGDYLIEEFMLVPQLYTNNIGIVGITGVNASKINYYTPEYMGFRAGLTYIPDLESFGTVSNAMSFYKDSSYNYGNYRDVVEGGIHYSGKMRGAGVKAAFVAETGTTADEGGDTLHRLRAWEAGVAVHHMNWTVAGAYGDQAKSGQYESYDAIASKYWNVGVAYEHGPFGVSLAYASTKSGILFSDKTTVSTVAAGADWRLAKGVKLYADVLNFRAKETEVVADSGVNNRGTLVRIGSLVHF